MTDQPDRVWLTVVDDKELWATTRRNPNAICYVPASELESVENDLDRLTAEGTTMRIALQAIAKHYKPNWKPGDTHVSTQRLSGIAHDALAV